MPLQRKSASCRTKRCNPLFHWSPVGVVVRRGHSIILQLNFTVLISLVLELWPSQVFLCETASSICSPPCTPFPGCSLSNLFPWTSDPCWLCFCFCFPLLGEQLVHWKIPWCWERLKAEGEEGNRGWDGWMASLMQWTWTWANSRRWWSTGKCYVLQSMESWRVRYHLVTEK